MKKLNSFIQEKLKISETSFMLEKLKITSKSEINHYNYVPENTDELKELLKDLIEKRGENADLNDIDTSKIDNMEGLFIGLNISNINISYWDVSNVENFRTMFWHCRKFNCNLSNWIL